MLILWAVLGNEAYDEYETKLEYYLEKYHDGSLTMEGIMGLKIHLSIADIICQGVAEGEAEVETLWAQV